MCQVATFPFQHHLHQLHVNQQTLLALQIPSYTAPVWQTGTGSAIRLIRQTKISVHHHQNLPSPRFPMYKPYDDLQPPMVLGSVHDPHPNCRTNGCPILVNMHQRRCLRSCRHSDQSSSNFAVTKTQTAVQTDAPSL